MNDQERDGGFPGPVIIERAEFIDRLLDASDDCIKILDLDAHVLFISANGQKALGIGDFELVRGAAWLDFWIGDDRIAASDALDCARDGSRGRFTGRMPVADVDRFWEVTVTPIRGAQGRPEHLLAVSRDISDVIRATRSIEESAERERLLAASIPGVTWTATPDGLLDHVSEGPEPRIRRPASSQLGTAWLECVHPEDRNDVRERWSACVVSGQRFESSMRVLMRDESYRWQLVRALPQRNELGAIVRWVGIDIDIDDRARADDAREMFVALAENSSDLIAIGDHAGAHVYLNAAGRHLVGIGTSAQARDETLFDLFSHDDARFVKSILLPTVAARGRWSGDLDIVDRQSGVKIPIACNAFALASDGGRELGMAMIGRDLRSSRRIETNMRALAEAGAAMHGALDFEGTIANVADAAVGSFASLCIVDAFDMHGNRRSVAASRRHPEAVPILERVAVARRARAEHPATRAIDLGESMLVSSVSSEWLDSIGVRAAVGAALDPFDIRSMMFVPIRSSRDERIVGSLTYARDGADPSGLYTADDLRFGEEIARRAGTAFDNASAYEHERRIAVTLQEASLPRKLPFSEYLQLSAAYRPGDSEATIGGDWYDAFALPDGRVVVTIGDVLGHGLDAAVTMGKVRQAMQSVAMVVDDLNTVLGVADRTIRAESADTYATALVGVFDLQRERFTFMSAGHPGPVVRHPDGRVEEISACGMMLGLRPADRQRAVTIAAPAGTTITFFTDGLVEATRDIDAGQARLRTAIADLRPDGGSDVAGALVDRVLGGLTSRDDIAVLVATVGPGVQGMAERPRFADTDIARTADTNDAHSRSFAPYTIRDGRMVMVIPSHLENVSHSRIAIRNWLAKLPLPMPQPLVALAELVAGELVANAVDHGNGIAVEVSVELKAGFAVIAVTNDGPLFAPAPKPFEEMLFEERGRGLALVTTFGCEMDVRANEANRCTVTATVPLEASII